RLLPLTLLSLSNPVIASKRKMWQMPTQEILRLATWAERTIFKPSPWLPRPIMLGIDSVMEKFPLSIARVFPFRETTKPLDPQILIEYIHGGLQQPMRRSTG